MDRLKIGILSDKCAPFYIGGYEDRLWNLARILARRNDVEIATSLARPSTTIEGVNFRRCSPTAFQAPPPADRSLLHSALFAASLGSNPFRGRSPDVVIVESIPYLHLGTMTRWMRSARFKKILDVNEAWATYAYFSGVMERPGAWLLRRLLSQGISLADQVVSISDVTKRSLEVAYHAQNVKVVPMGLDWSLMPEASPSHDPRFDFVTLARLVGIKRVRDALKAYSILKSTRGWSGMAAVIGDGPERQNLERLAVSLGIESQVVFTGLVSASEKFRILRDSRVFVLASEREGFSLATLEAMACGLAPVVAEPDQSETFGVSHLVSVGSNGEGYPVGDSTALAGVLWRLLQDDSYRLRLGREALATSRLYGWDKIAEKLELDLRILCSNQ
jgi:glycosyltransferase involved in cell wall biosynthesis